jgi:transketolase
MNLEFGPRRAVYIDIAAELVGGGPLDAAAIGHLDAFDLVYRSLCALMYNYVPMSGHPGGSISSGPFVAALLYDAMDYDLSDPDRQDADILSYAAGHKALGLYAMLALRNEVARIAAPELLASDARQQLRLEDLLGFRRNPVTTTPLFTLLRAKALDGHPTPATPFVKLSTGASGVGVATSIGLAFAARDYYGPNAPRVHIVEGEGGLTPGRVAEAIAAAGTASLDNAIVHLDWNQASIDSNHVCRDEGKPGDYVQWNPLELFYLHDWNVVYVADGRDWGQVVAAQRRALAMDNGQPTAVIYRTTKGWQYGIEGRASHGAGHPLCSDGFYRAVDPLASLMGVTLPACCDGEQRCAGVGGDDVREQCYWDALQIVRRSLETQAPVTAFLGGRVREARRRLDASNRVPRRPELQVERVYELAASGVGSVPAELQLAPGTATTLRGELGKALRYLNRESGGTILAASADLLGSTSINAAAADFAGGFYNARSNPDARLLSTGGICEDAMMGILSGLSTFGHHIGAGSSYGAFIAALGHIPVRLHAIGAQARRETAPGEPFKPVFLICAHAGVKTGEDGPTHADPQPLQILAENFPRGTMITLTPWDPSEVWPLVAQALVRRPAVIAPYITRPTEVVPDRAALGLAPALACVSGVYLLRAARGTRQGTLVLQGSEVAYDFVRSALPRLEKDGIDLDVYYVSSGELFDLLPAAEQARIFPEARAREAMGITGFTLPTMYRWIQSDRGRAMTMHPFQKGFFLGSGQADKVLAQAGLDGEGQYRQIVAYVEGTKIAAEV